MKKHKLYGGGELDSSHSKSSSILQLSEHPSLITKLPSSHSYPTFIKPSPHIPDTGMLEHASLTRS